MSRALGVQLVREGDLLRLIDLATGQPILTTAGKAAIARAEWERARLVRRSNCLARRAWAAAADAARADAAKARAEAAEAKVDAAEAKVDAAEQRALAAELTLENERLRARLGTGGGQAPPPGP